MTLWYKVQSELARLLAGLAELSFADFMPLPLDTGMIKYNTGGRGLTVGIRDKVQELVELLSLVPCLHRLHVHLIDGAISRLRFPSGRVHRVQDEQNYSTSQTALDPFNRLCGVRRAKVTGTSTAYAEALERSMMDSRDFLHA